MYTWLECGQVLIKSGGLLIVLTAYQVPSLQDGLRSLIIRLPYDGNKYIRIRAVTCQISNIDNLLLHRLDNSESVWNSYRSHFYYSGDGWDGLIQNTEMQWNIKYKLIVSECNIATYKTKVISGLVSWCVIMSLAPLLHAATQSFTTIRSKIQNKISLLKC